VPTRTDSNGTSRILTLVFTDLADSTALKARRGDQAVGELIARHRAQVQRLAAESGGRIIDWAGDGCFLTCETSSAAVLFALRLQHVHGDEPDLPGVRIGMHMGEVSERPGPDGDDAHPRVEGLAVDLAARISSLARPGQVLMSSSVADNARQRLASAVFGQPIGWRTHGSYLLKGFDEALEIREAGIEGIASFTLPVATMRQSNNCAPRSPSIQTTFLRMSGLGKRICVWAGFPRRLLNCTPGYS
jgi:class 3 adenylate cyclase